MSKRLEKKKALALRDAEFDYRTELEEMKLFLRAVSRVDYSGMPIAKELMVNQEFYEVLEALAEDQEDSLGADVRICEGGIEAMGVLFKKSPS